MKTVEVLFEHQKRAVVFQPKTPYISVHFYDQLTFQVIRYDERLYTYIHAHIHTKILNKF